MSRYEDTMYLTYADIAERTGLTVNALRQMRHRGKLPPPDLQPNPRTALWLTETIDEWIGGHDGRETR